MTTEYFLRARHCSQNFPSVSVTLGNNPLRPTQASAPLTDEEAELMRLRKLPKSSQSMTFYSRKPFISTHILAYMFKGLYI